MIQALAMVLRSQEISMRKLNSSIHIMIEMTEDCHPQEG